MALFLYLQQLVGRDIQCLGDQEQCIEGDAHRHIRGLHLGEEPGADPRPLGQLLLAQAPQPAEVGDADADGDIVVPEPGQVVFALDSSHPH